MILLRHGETLFNRVYGATRLDPGIADPALTDVGRAQAEAAARRLASEDVRRLIASPYTRTLETAEIIARTLRIPVSVDARVRERSAFACDVGTPRSALAARWSDLALDHLDEVWWHAPGEAEHALDARCAEFRADISRVADWPHVAVITHWGVIRSLVRVSVPNGESVRFDPTRPPAVA